MPYWPKSACRSCSGPGVRQPDERVWRQDDLAELCYWTAVAVSRDSSDPDLWTLLAGADVELKAYGLAHTEYQRALECDRWYTQALEGLGQLAVVQRNWKAAVHWYRLAVATDVKIPLASAALRRLLAGAERKAGLVRR